MEIIEEKGIETLALILILILIAIGLENELKRKSKGIYRSGDGNRDWGRALKIAERKMSNLNFKEGRGKEEEKRRGRVEEEKRKEEWKGFCSFGK